MNRDARLRGTGGTPLRVLTNRAWLAEHRIGDRVIHVEMLVARPRRVEEWLKQLAIWRYDAILLDCEIRWTFILCAVKRILPFVHCPLVVVDPVFTRPSNWRERLKFIVRRWLLGATDRFVLYFRDSAEFQRVYAVDDARVRYVPFKANTREQLASVTISDEGFFLSCGRSNRDLRTLFEAFRGLPYDCRVLAQWEEVEHHGTTVQGLRRPSNVTLISDDGTPESWNRWIARARAIVLPIEPGKLSPAGLGTYLVAMALGKCVVMTEGPATRGLIDDGQAVLVPPQVSDALREAVRRIAEDPEYRSRVAAAGRDYALSLGGEERLREDLVAQLGELLTT